MVQGNQRLEIQRLSSLCTRLQSELHNAREAPAPPAEELLSNENFNRDTSPRILRISSHKNASVERGSVLAAVADHAALCRIMEKYTVLGNAEASKFTLQFDGTELLAASAAARFFQGLRTAGKWAKMSAAGAGDDQGRDVQIYCNPDRNPAQIMAKMHGRLFAKALGEFIPNKKVYSKDDGSISVDFIPIAKVTPSHEDKRSRRAAHAGIYPAALNALGVSKDAVIERYKQLASSTQETTEELEDIHF